MEDGDKNLGAYKAKSIDGAEQARVDHQPYLMFASTFPTEGQMRIVYGRDGVRTALATEFVFGGGQAAELSDEHNAELDSLMEGFDDPEAWGGPMFNWSFEDGGIEIIRLDPALALAADGKAPAPPGSAERSGANTTPQDHRESGEDMVKTGSPEAGSHLLRAASSDLAKRLRQACNGHPHAKIPWPHRILHEAADHIEAFTYCEDCPPVGYPTDKTRCTPCPRRTVGSSAKPDAEGSIPNNSSPTPEVERLREAALELQTVLAEEGWTVTTYGRIGAARQKLDAALSALPSEGRSGEKS